MNERKKCKKTKQGKHKSKSKLIQLITAMKVYCIRNNHNPMSYKVIKDQFSQECNAKPIHCTILTPYIYIYWLKIFTPSM